MPVNKTIRFGFLAIAISFLLYLAYASTLYHPWFSTSFWVITAVAIISVVVVSYFVCVGVERIIDE